MNTGKFPPVMPSSRRPVIFLTGYRGSGKTSVAKLLAGRLGWQWLDADEALVARHGKTIRAIFAEEGEAGFRDKEAGLLDELCRLREHVVASGGGVVLRPENRGKLRSGLVIWLTADAATLWRRISSDATTTEQRPNLTGGGLSEVEELLRVREPLYRGCADLVVDTTGKSPEQVVEAILDRKSVV